MERQYIFFRTGRALLVFAGGIALIAASTELLRYLAPNQGGLALSTAVVLAVVVIVASFKVDARFWRRPTGR